MSDQNSFFSTSGGSLDFLESNSLVAKFAFILLVLFGFVVIFKMSVQLLKKFTNSIKDSPHLLDGMIDATQALTYTQDPSQTDSVTIYRSNNASDGIEFTWSVWIYIENMQYNQGMYKTIFFKGNNKIQEDGLNYPNNAPGLFIAPNTNTLVVLMNGYNEIAHEITVPDIPLNKWVNVILRLENRTFDIYINGVITRSVEFDGVVKQNYGDVYVAQNGGFQGNISNLWYYGYALGTTEIQRIANQGPNLTFKGNQQTTSSDYLSLKWYFYGAGNQFTPS
jgi:hypothetical protein